DGYSSAEAKGHDAKQPVSNRAVTSPDPGASASPAKRWTSLGALRPASTVAVAGQALRSPATKTRRSGGLMKRIVLFLITNVAVMLVLTIVVRLLGLDQALAANGLNAGGLLVFSAVFGVGGAFISLLLSKTMAKWSTGAQVIGEPRNENETWLLATVKKLADKAGIAM